jgi:hypothetical protein
LFVFAAVLAACSKDKREEPNAAASAQAPVASTAPSAVGPAAPANAWSLDVAAARAVEKSCTDICERSRTLKCKGSADDCMKSCIGMAIGTPCRDAFTALYACFGREPAEHWECGEDGIAAIREGFCEKEQERTVTCMEEKAQP